MVKSPGPAAPPRIPLAAAVGRTGSSAIRDLLEITERPEVLSLAGGLPTPEAFPVAALAVATADVLADDAEAALQYGATEGFRPLRTWVADRYAVEVDEVTVTATGAEVVIGGNPVEIRPKLVESVLAAGGLLQNIQDKGPSLEDLFLKLTGAVPDAPPPSGDDAGEDRP